VPRFFGALQYLCDESKLDKKGCLGAPEIVVEILSPSNNRKELTNKYEIYEQAGVIEYWVVFPEERAIVIYTLTDGKYLGSRPFTEGQIITSKVLAAFELNITDIFENLRQEE
jgi:Uma2 family endonuclease